MLCVVTMVTVLLLSVCQLGAIAEVTTTGDVNADDSIDMKDVLMLRKEIAGLGKVTNARAADCNGDGNVDMKDVLLLRKYIAQMGVELAPLTQPTTTQSATTTTKSGLDVKVTYEYCSDIPEMIKLAYYNQDCTEIGLTWHTQIESQKPVAQFVKVTPGSTEPDFSKATVVDVTVDQYVEDHCFPYDYETDSYIWDSKGFKTCIDYCHRAVLKDLEPGTTYAYRCGDAGKDKWSDVATFQTKGETVDSFSFVYMSDTQAEPISKTGVARDYWLNAWKGAVQMNPDLRFLLHGGDMVQGTQYMFLYQNALNGCKDYLMKYPMMPVSGNHESSQSTAGQYRQIAHSTIDLPEGIENLSSGAYYSFNYGDCHFVMLNSDDGGMVSISSTQRNWLKADLAASTQKWKICVLHQPIVSCKKKSSIAYPLMKIFDQYDVDLVIEAHEHVYMKSYPLDKDKNIMPYDTETIDGISYYKNPQGMVVAQFATGGSKANNLGTGDDLALCPYYSNGQQSAWANIEISGDKMTVTPYYYNDGNPKTFVGGAWGIIKESAGEVSE